MIGLLLVALLARPDVVHDVQSLTRQQICAVRWGLDRRHVTEAMKQEIARRAGIRRSTIVGHGRGPCCEFDHIVPRELGGADVLENLQLQPWKIATRKDADENAMHKAVCAGTVGLKEAQQRMRDWKP